MSRQLFAIPERRAYPIGDASHADLALRYLMRVRGRWGVNADRRETARRVLAAVRKRWPNVYRARADLVDRIKSAYGIGRGEVRKAAEGTMFDLLEAPPVRVYAGESLVGEGETLWEATDEEVWAAAEEGTRVMAHDSDTGLYYEIGPNEDGEPSWQPVN